MTTASFMSGLMTGLSVPATALRPVRIETPIRGEVLKSSYRPARDDSENIRRDFEKAVRYVHEEAKRAS